MLKLNPLVPSSNKAKQNHWIIFATLKKKLAVFPSPAGMSFTKLSLVGKSLKFLARESLDSDIPAGDGKIANLFYSVISTTIQQWRHTVSQLKETKLCKF
jgi:hypothetical protein